MFNIQYSMFNAQCSSENTMAVGRLKLGFYWFTKRPIRFLKPEGLLRSSQPVKKQVLMIYPFTNLSPLDQPPQQVF
jgi:hypothetical protein